VDNFLRFSNNPAPAPSPSGLFPKAETTLVISQITSEIRISFVIRLMPVGAKQGTCAFCSIYLWYLVGSLRL